MNPIYLLASLAGIAVLVGLNRLLLKTRVPVLERTVAEELLRLDDPRSRLRAFVGDDRAGLGEDQEGKLFAFAVSGDRLVARLLGPASIAAANYAQGRLTVRLRDYGFRGIRFVLDPEQAVVWLDALKRVSNERRQPVIEGEALSL